MTAKRTASVLALIVAASVAVVVALSSPGDQGSETVSLTGCLRAGSEPTVFILRGAEMPAGALVPSGAAPPRAAEDYLLVQIPEGVDLGKMLNHRVNVVGLVSDAKSGPAPPREANAAERALKRLSVQRTREVAPNCSGA